ncbi:MAG TPA: 3-phosphoshikimate 1-carboxyvinyltransferase [Gammaproteobacteria bacterium]|nr:3-phosphoshikimate 1-carboxyvinyltransferase [Gammaproteobacteria bacterium]
MDLIARGGQLSGTLRVPGDKSISHRAAILSSLAQGTIYIKGFLPSLDCLATVRAMQQMGAKIAFHADETYLTIEGVGLQGLTAPDVPIDCQNAGTGIRLLAGILAGIPKTSILTGDSSLQKRPMARIVQPLRAMGAKIACEEEGAECYPPLTLVGKFPLTPISHTLSVASAQVKSCLLLAGLFAKGTTELLGAIESRDHTEKLLQTFDYPITVTKKRIALEGLGVLKAKDIQIPADISSAAFFIVGSAMMPGSEICLKSVGINPYRLGIIQLLQKMGARIYLENERQFGYEPVADIWVQGARLQGITIDKTWVQSTIDEFPALFIACALAEGQTLVRGAEELRVKESDRLNSMAIGLKTLGVPVKVYPDGLSIQGIEAFGSGVIDSFGDHRIAMAFAMASLAAKGPITIKNCEPIATSFPDFYSFANKAGLQLSQV